MLNLTSFDTTANRRYLDAFCAAPDLASAASIPVNGSAVSRVAAVGFGVLRHASQDADTGLEVLLEHNLAKQIAQERQALAPLRVAIALSVCGVMLFGLFGPGAVLAFAIPALLGAEFARRRARAITLDVARLADEFLERTRRQSRTRTTTVTPFWPTRGLASSLAAWKTNRWADSTPTTVTHRASMPGIRSPR